jgi:regulator of PEP synthase PpsR (kinase-PPPase family)
MSISAIGNTNGKPHPHTEETKRKIGLLKMGNKNCIGRVISDETKAKMRQKRLEYLAKSRNLPL